MNKVLQIFCLTLCYFFAANTLAQPFNDSCQDARTLINLNNGCTSISFVGATFDRLSGSCTPNDYPNAWFEFTAQGEDLEIEVMAAADAYITLWNVSPLLPCNDTFWTQEICAVNLLAVGNRLTIGRKYKLSVAFESPNLFNYQICINNPQPTGIPPNDHPCGADLLPADGSCFTGHNNNATPGFLNPECLTFSEASVWYKTFLTPGHSRLQLTMGVQFTGGYSVFLCRFNNNNCNSYPTIVGDTVYCDDLPDLDTIIFENLSANTVYYVQIASRTSATGPFSFCLQELEDPNGCGINDNCLGATDISVAASEPEPICFSGCNLSALPGPMESPGTCYFMENPTVWHVIEPDLTAAALLISLSSTQLQNPQIALYTGDTCSDLTPVLCDFSTDGFLDVALFDLISGNKYFLAVSDLFGDEGEYEVCIDQFTLEVGCNIINSLRPTNTSFGSPLNGPYQSGESVTFCYQLTAWQKGLCNWVQGIVPQFGTAWDPVSFRPNGQPATVTKALEAHVPGNWRWYSAGVVDYNVFNPDKGYTVGSPMPAGWYFTNNAVNQNNPDLSRGDGDNCDLESGVSWEVCFALKVKDFEDCMMLDGDDASVRVETFSDSEIGSYPAVSCLMDQPKILVADLVCCQGPSIADANFNSCNGAQFIYNLNPTNNPNLNFAWTAIIPDGVFGAESGTGNIINDVIFNFTLTTQVVTYLVSVADTSGCFGAPAAVTVNVQPAVRVDAGEGQETCAGVSVRLGGSPTASGGSGNYMYNWSTGSPNQANPFYVVEETELIFVVVTDSRGCRGTDSVLYEVLPVPRTSLNVQLCPGDTFEFNGQLITDAGNYDRFITNGAANGCDSIVTAIVVLYDLIVLDDQTVTPDDGSENGTISIDLRGGSPPYVVNWSNGATGTTITGVKSGSITATVRDANNCEVEFNFFVPLMSGSREQELASFMQIQPNPIHSASTWYVNNNSSIDIERLSIYSINGQLISQLNPSIGIGTITMPFINESAGLYLLKIELDQTVIYKRVIVQK
jgi:hypothetical protein